MPRKKKLETLIVLERCPIALRFPVTPLPARRLLLDKRKLNLMLNRIHAVHQHAQAVADRVGLPVSLADDLAGVLVIGVAIAGDGGERHQAFDEQFVELDEETELGDADDQPVELLTQALLHEFSFFPFE